MAHARAMHGVIQAEEVALNIADGEQAIDGLVFFRAHLRIVVHMQALIRICPDSIDAFYAAFGRSSPVGQLASSIPFKLSPTRFKHRNFDNEPHIHISCGKKKNEKSLFPVKTNAQPCSTILKQPG